MKWICIFLGFFGLPRSLAAEGVDHLITDAEQLEQRGETKVEYSKLVYAEVTKALELDPDSDFGHLILAQWNLQMVLLNPFFKAFAQMIYGQFPTASTEEAIAHYKKAIELAPGRIVHHAEYAKALDVLGDTVAARQQWTKVTELKPIWAQDRRYQTMAMQRLQIR